jgi:hypothetical protein
MVAQINGEGNSSSQTQQVVILQGICQPAHKQTTSTKIQEKQNQSETSVSAHKQPLQHGEKRQQTGTNQKETIQRAEGGYFTSNLPQTKS